MKVTMRDYTHKESADWGQANKVTEHGKDDSYVRQTFIIHRPEGIIWASTYREDRFEITQMWFVYNGREHHRYWLKVWGDKTIARLAREMVVDIVERVGDDG